MTEIVQIGDLKVGDIIGQSWKRMEDLLACEMPCNRKIISIEDYDDDRSIIVFGATNVNRWGGVSILKTAYILKQVEILR